MSAPKPLLPADQAMRDEAIVERARNVLIDAGAGTGKTTLLADRLVELVAPERSKAPPIPIDRIAAITFTRKAAGELRLKVREKLLAGLARCEPTTERASLLRGALSGLDTAHISTIHSFCDRLLRLRPVEAELSPSYDIAEQPEALHQETLHLLLDSAEAGRLETELADTDAAGLAADAQRTIVDALAVGLKRDTRETEFWNYFGLDALVAAFCDQRDVPPTLPPAPRFSAKDFHEARESFLRRAKSLETRSRGGRWIASLAAELRGLKDEDDPTRIWSTLGKLVIGPGGKKSAQKEADFANDEDSWGLWKLHSEGKYKKEKLDAALRDQMLGALHRWMARRLVRLFPVVVALYDKVKARRRQLDQIDLLLRLRRLLASDLESRTFYQGLFDHIFVDEFQDTDPLQAEVVLFLCEARAVATSWDQVELAPGRLTVVGDPKQSIYRFRRADIAVYDQVRGHVSRGDCLSITLSTNFRSKGPLIDFINERFSGVFGTAKDGGPLFDPEEGTVRHQNLGAAPGASGGGACVRALPLVGGAGAKADDYRALESQALARYLRHLVDGSKTEITDPTNGQRRPLRFGDIAVLAISTWNLRLLLPALDTFGIPHAVRGGRLLLQDLLHRQLVLALRALADRDDGPAQAALLRPPFFALDLGDLLHERATRAAERGEPLQGAIDPERSRRAREALDLITELRRERLSRPVAATARDVIERTAFGRMLATGPNGEQRLAQAHEICRALDQVATAEGLDYDGATARARAWVDEPIQLDPPHPVGDGALQVMTVHQAKGLEFPVVVLWDGMAEWKSPQQTGAFNVSRDGKAWAMQLDGLEWKEPESANLKKREQAFLNAERQRVVYVATTRARELLILPAAGGAKPERHVCAGLLSGATDDLVERVEAFSAEEQPAWAASVQPAPTVDVAPPSRKTLANARAAEAKLSTEWDEAARASAAPHLAPASVTQLAHGPGAVVGHGPAAVAPGSVVAARGPSEAPLDGPDVVLLANKDTFEDLEHHAAAPSRTARVSRHGTSFGEVVHHAIGFKLSDPALSAAEAVSRAARLAGLDEHLEEAVADVERTTAALDAAGLLSGEWRLEYPVWGVRGGTQLLQGFIDLLAVGPSGELVVIDFKTDASMPGEVAVTHPGYVAQVRAYRELLEGANVKGSGATRCALLFTGDGGMRWCG